MFRLKTAGSFVSNSVVIFFPLLCYKRLGKGIVVELLCLSGCLVFTDIFLAPVFAF